MDFNNLQLRLKRLFNALNLRYDQDIKSNIKFSRTVSQGVHTIGFSFEDKDETEITNRIFQMISAIASLKDHLKSEMTRNKKNPKLVEDLIDNSLELSLILDLWNQDKHGYPLKKSNRSNKNPKIVNISRGLITTGGKGSISFEITPEKTNFQKSEGGIAIHIGAEIVDDKGKFIIFLDDLLENAVREIEDFLTKNNIS